VSGFDADNIQLRKGLEFEQFIVSKFDTPGVCLHNSQGDKSYKNIYPETNKNPDLIYKIKESGRRDFFAIECKWRINDNNGVVSFAKPYQLENYCRFVDRMRIQLFVIIGLCGKPSAPANLFVIPFKDVYDMCFLDITLLRMYQRDKEAKFYWDEKRRMVV